MRTHFGRESRSGASRALGLLPVGSTGKEAVEVVHARRRLELLVGACLLALIAGACSSGGGEGTEGTGSPGATGETGEAVRGGTLNMLGSGDVDYMDPNVTYYSIGYLGTRMWSRQL